MKTKPNWQAIWLEIAEAYGTPYEERTREQIHLAEFGLCSAVEDLGIMFDNFDILGVETCFGYWWPVSWSKSITFNDFMPIYDTYRCQFACFMAAMSNQEFEELLKSEGITYEQ
jgi:hypothetical protein